jgi:lipopolysaccharide transport system ATP-binding protein
MSQYVIEAEDLGKRFLLGEDSNALRVKQALHAIAPKLATPDLQQLWALRHVSFKAGAGEAIGIIGGNGAGKSTLLKVLSRITPPTEGRALVRGRVGTLLEVGTGFHPELTGRDNIALSGSILGMHPHEVARKFDEIVAFAELSKFLDTPVKRYSSGMYTRLAFAVAAFLDPEILIVDEVLAVGDAAFQRKSLGRLTDATEREGRTVFFVSHNFQAVRNFCRRVIVLRHGNVVFDGPTEEGVELYLKAIPNEIDLRGAAMKNRLNRSSGAVRFTSIAASNDHGAPSWKFQVGDTVRLRIGYEVVESVPDLAILLHLGSAADGQTVTALHDVVSEGPLATGKTGTIEFRLPNIQLRPGAFTVRADFQTVDSRLAFDVLDTNVDIPFLTITSEETNPYLRTGHVSLNYDMRVSDGG